MADEHGTHFSGVIYCDKVIEKSPVTSPKRMFGEIPDGFMDGVNRIFILNNEPIKNSDRLFLNGLRIKNGGDYIINSAVIFMLSAPLNTDLITADYDFQ